MSGLQLGCAFPVPGHAPRGHTGLAGTGWLLARLGRSWAQAQEWWLSVSPPDATAAGNAGSRKPRISGGSGAGLHGLCGLCIIRCDGEGSPGDAASGPHSGGALVAERGLAGSISRRTRSCHAPGWVPGMSGSTKGPGQPGLSRATCVCSVQGMCPRSGSALSFAIGSPGRG